MEYQVGQMIQFYRNDVGMLEGVIDEVGIDDAFWVIGDDGLEYEVYGRDIEGIVE